jgi:tetraacyldisaccharide 4'-kinase
MREILFPAGWLYQGLTGFRNWCYDHSLRKTFQVESKVISIGNVTMGGTGKTPVTLALIAELERRGCSCGVVSRGYKRGQSGILEVVGPADGEDSAGTGAKAAQTFGDEPALIKAAFPSVPVFVGETKVGAAEALLKNSPVRIILCDDGFQHRRLHRDLNLLLFDASEPLKNYRVAPVGRARESLAPALRRADFLIVTKANLVEPEHLESVLEWLKQRTDKPVLTAEYRFDGLRSRLGRTARELKDSVYLVSGIAKPEALEKTLAGRVRVVKHRIFEDHHRYSHLEVEEILDEASRLQARWVLTTAKDSMKLGAFPRLRERLWVVELGVEFKGDVRGLYEAIDRLARPGR